jgi:3',5'-cyclic AMP phosphodiesterase CpdA
LTPPTILLQLSDPHLGARWNGADPAARLAAAVACARALLPRVDAVLVTGDVTDTGGDAECVQARELLAPLGAPVHILPGNHDARSALRRAFHLPGAADDPVQYAVDVGRLRLVVVDTVRPGRDDGALPAERLAWLDAALAARPGAPTVVAMHHPPIVTGVRAMDAIGLPADDRRALAGVLAAHAQVQRVAAGHVHRAVVGEIGGRPVLAGPSTYVELRLAIGAAELAFADEPAGFAVHALVDGALVSHVQPVV